MTNASDTGSKPLIDCRNVTKTFVEGKLFVEVLRGINLAVDNAQKLAIVGTSGSGKSTLLHILGSLSNPTKGTVYVDGIDLATLSEPQKNTLRNRNFGFVYQFHHLLPEFSALENVAMPLLIRRENKAHAFATASEILERVGLQSRLKHKPRELSGGERQRAAIARAMVARPKCIMADEPTGNLDAKTAASIHALLLELNADYGTSLIVVTHDLNLAGKIGTVVNLEDGRIC